MKICVNSKKVRPPLKPREGQYKKTNAYTKRMCFQQIMTLVLAFTTVILHSIFLVSAIIKINHPVSYVMLALNYVLIVGLVITYIQVTTFDPVDRYITNPQMSDINKDETREYCGLCCSYVHQRSYHCKRCSRCTQNFDHHCVYLNSCIGSLNYELFLRILIFYIIFLLNNIGQAIWVFIASRSSQQVKAATITEWMSIAIIIICFLQLVATTVLLTFHCYISCCLDVTTLKFMESEQRSQRSKLSHTPYGQQSSDNQEASPSNFYPNAKSDTKQNIYAEGIIV